MSTAWVRAAVRRTAVGALRLDLPVEVKDLRIAIARSVDANDGRVEDAGGAAGVCGDFKFEGAAGDVAKTLDLAQELETNARDAAQLVDAAIGAHQAAAVVLTATSTDDGLGAEGVHARDQLEHRRRSGID